MGVGYHSLGALVSTLLTFKDLQDRFLRWIDEGGDTSTTRQLAKDAISASHRRLLTSRIWPFMKWPVYETFTTTANTTAYALHPQMQKPLFFYDGTRQIYIPLVPRREWPGIGVRVATTTPIATSAVYGGILGTNWPVKVQPVTASVLTLQSDNGAESGAGLYVEGRDGSGNFVSETLPAVTATTPVTSANSYTYLTQVAKTTAWVGTLTLKAGATVLTTISASDPGQWYPTIELTETPVVGTTITYSFQRLPKTLTNDLDIPDTPYPYSEFHIYDALLDLTTYNTELGQKEQALWKDRKDELLKGLLNAYDEQIAGSYVRTVRDLDAAGVSNRMFNYNPSG